MNNWVKLGIGLIVAGGVGTLIYLGIKKKADAKKANDPNEQTKDPVPKGPFDLVKPPAPGPTDSFPIKMSARGPNVLKVQTAIINIFNDGSVGSPDGVLGPRTKAAIEKLGYSLPLSEVDFKALVAGVKKTAPASTQTVINRNAHAKYDDISTYNVSNNNKARTYKKNDWILTVRGTGTDIGGPFYTDGIVKVSQANVNLK